MHTLLIFVAISLYHNLILRDFVPYSKLLLRECDKRATVESPVACKLIFSRKELTECVVLFRSLTKKQLNKMRSYLSTFLEYINGVINKYWMRFL